MVRPKDKIETMLMQNFGGQAKTMVFFKVAHNIRIQNFLLLDN